MDEQSDKSITKEEIESKLKSLGGSPAQIAETLNELGISGSRFNIKSCPIADFIKNEIIKRRNFLYFVVTSSKVYVKEKDLEPGIVIGLEEQVKNFIEAFDEGAYPFLDRGANV